MLRALRRTCPRAEVVVDGGEKEGGLRGSFRWFFSDAGMNDWCDKQVTIVPPHAFQVLVPSISLLVTTGDAALAVHALAARVPVLCMCPVVPCRRFNTVDTFWMVRLHLAQFGAREEDEEDEEEGFERLLTRMLEGAAEGRVRVLAGRLRAEREEALDWHRRKQRKQRKGVKGGGGEEENSKLHEFVDEEVDWLNDEIERLGDGAVVVARAVLDRVGVRPQAQRKHAGGVGFAD